MELTSGFINLNKPSGISSAAAVSKIKRLTGLACGHMGTLDPLASGVLPVAFGNASRLFNYLLDKEKVYRAVFRFGTDTDTLDSAGEILKSGLPVPTEDKINSVLSEFVGEIEQVPPIYSAKSVGGVRAYRLARQGKEVELSAKRVTVHSLVLLGRLNETDYEFRISCGLRKKGHCSFAGFARQTERNGLRISHILRRRHLYPLARARCRRRVRHLRNHDVARPRKERCL